MNTRSRNKSLSSEKQEIKNLKESKSHIENSWILLAKDSILANSNFSIITLPHPSHGSPTKYCLDDVNHKIYEIITFSEPYRSWFIGDTVKSDGSLLISTPINPLFLVLPRLRNQCKSRAVPLEDLLSEKGFHKIIDFISDLDAVADLKGPEDMKAYKYNEEKSIAWLENKIRRLAKTLKEKNIHVSAGAVSATFICSTVSNENVEEEFYLKYAHGMISEYLEDYFVELLEKQFQFKSELAEHLGNKRKSEAEEIKETNKRMKQEIINDVKFNLNTSVSEIKKPKALTAKEKARQKAANGTKTISSFFSKK